MKIKKNINKLNMETNSIPAIEILRLCPYNDNNMQLSMPHEKAYKV